jgi:hypothetical protein
MKRLGALCLAAALLAACAGPGKSPGGASAGPSPKTAAVVFQKKTFKLVKTPDPDLEAALEGMLLTSFEAAVKEHSGDKPLEIGFTYSISPKGAVYPFSEIEVSCIMQEKYARRSGPQLCGDFFRELGVKVKRAVAARQQ